MFSNQNGERWCPQRSDLFAMGYCDCSNTLSLDFFLGGGVTGISYFRVLTSFVNTMIKHKIYT